MQSRRREIAVRSVVCAVLFLLLDCLHASAVERKLSALAVNFPRYPTLFQQIIHTSWLGPGLLLGLLLMVLALLSHSSRKSQIKHGLVRQFRTPSLDRYRGDFPKRHQDLDF